MGSSHFSAFFDLLRPSAETKDLKASKKPLVPVLECFCDNGKIPFGSSVVVFLPKQHFYEFHLKDQITKK